MVSGWTGGETILEEKTMSDSELKPNEADFPEDKPLTDEESEWDRYMEDVNRDTTLDGKPRCVHRYRYYDRLGPRTLRCTKEATLREGQEQPDIDRCEGDCFLGKLIKSLLTPGGRRPPES
jgi:hypothetical protein